jgi:Domain of unknown function (DUF4157)
MSDKTTARLAVEKKSQPVPALSLGPRVPPSLSSGNSFFSLHQAFGNQAMVQLLDSGALQAKLRVSQPGDADEIEADRAAEQVVAATHGSPKIQRKCACSGSGSPCAKCAEEDTDTIHRSVSSPLLSPFTPALQRAPANDGPTNSSEQNGDPPKPSPTPSRAHPLVVEDDAKSLLPGQMRKSAFIALLRTDACATADAVLMSVGRTTKSCPYIEKWLAFYEKQSSDHLERAIVKYAPEAGEAKSAREAIHLLVARAQRAAMTWVKTGKVTGMPPGMSLAPEDVSSQDAAKPQSPNQTGPAGTKEPVQVPARTGATVVRRKANSERTPAPEAIRSELSHGQPLAPLVRSRMESAFSEDFSAVRVHTDSHAARLSAQIDARAFTLGHDIAFASGQYEPGSIAGDALIAHELAHVVQQKGGHQVPMPASNDGTPDNRLENEADQSAFQVVSSLWGHFKGAGSGMVAKALPRLRSGFRLQRCSCDRSKEVKPTAPLKDVLPTFACVPTPVGLEEIRKLPGVPAGVLGITKAAAPHPQITIHSSSNSSCTLEVTSMPQFGLDHFLYAKPGTYDMGSTSTIQHGKCKGKTVPDKITVTPALSEKAKAGEAEHCEDDRRAYMLSMGRYTQVFDELSHPYCAEGSDCDTETNNRFKERTGVEWKDVGKVENCLFDKTGDRDRRDWHTVEIDQRTGRPTPDCSAIIYTPDASKALPDVGKHKSEELVKGCGE